MRINHNSEVRIGNIIKRDGNIVEVAVWMLNEIMPLSKVVYEGVELTGEILEKAGFKYVPNTSPNYMKFDAGVGLGGYNIKFFYCAGENPEFGMSIDDAEGGKDLIFNIKHLHQLQNLYYTLTNQELHITITDLKTLEK